MPGVGATPRRALLAGALVVITVLAITITAWCVTTRPDPGATRIQLRISRSADGIITGAGVRLHGVRVGEVTEVESRPEGDQVLTLALENAQIAGLTDRFDVEYAPSNLFGLSEVILRPDSGGAALRNGAVIDLAESQIADVTMGTLMQSLSETTTSILTPQMTEVLSQAGTQLRSFAPLLQTVLELGRTVADTQRYSTSFLIGQYGSFATGIAQFGNGFVKLVDAVYATDLLRNNLDQFNVAVTLVVDQLLPMVSQLGESVHRHFGDYAGSTAVLLARLAETVPDPDRAHADLSELLKRLDQSFATTPDGVRVQLEVALRAMPGIAVPLLGGGLTDITTPGR
ncbi:Mce family protein [Nocardia sp. 2]|uniref:Mce family protein n=1 Tax=Nocardia acididurans TaxID=2802282 RepID=A0ABS1MG98_9NOCA|nr:MlaD family protein [Nocardia acididurans]MBL1079604.1 Mce family protein [Nocardia acididurans]